MEKTSTLVHSLYENTNSYLKLQVRSAKLEAYERVTNLVAHSVSAAVAFLLGIFAFLFINVGLGLWLGSLLNSNVLGFMCLGGFYAVVLGIYLLLKDKVAKNRLKNAVLLKVSKTMNDYEALLKEQEQVHAQVETSGQALKRDFDELKGNIETLQEDLRRLKRNFVSEDTGDENTRVGPKIPRAVITSAVDLILNKLVLRDAGLVKRHLWPLIANTLITSKVFKETKKTSLLQNLKLKFSKFL